MLTIVGWLWRDPNCRTPYTPEHVDIWASMIHRNLTIPHRFLVFTDNMADKFTDLVEKAPLWKEWHLLDNPGWPAGLPQCYVRLQAFSDAPEIKALLGPRYASIDLDCLVLGNLDKTLSRKERFVIWRRPSFEKNGFRDPYNSSIWLADTGALPELWRDFHGAPSIGNMPQQKEYLMTDQGWIRYKLGPKMPVWTQDDGIFMWSWLQRKGINPERDEKGNYFVEYREKKTQCRLIFFNGRLKPWSYDWLREAWQ